MEGRYSPGIWVELTDCTDPTREAEFNRWYDKTYIPHMEDLGFVRNSKRYENARSNEPTFLGRPKYLTLAEVYRSDLEQAGKDIRISITELQTRGQGFDAMAAKMDTLYRRTGPEFRSERTGKPIQAIFCALVACNDQAREEEFNRWYNEKHSLETLESGLFDTGYRYKVVDPHDPMPHQSAPYASLYETSADPLTVLEAIPGLRRERLSDSLYVGLLSIYYGALFRPICH